MFHPQRIIMSQYSPPVIPLGSRISKNILHFMNFSCYGMEFPSVEQTFLTRNFPSYNTLSQLSFQAITGGNLKNVYWENCQVNPMETHTHKHPEKPWSFHPISPNWCYRSNSLVKVKILGWPLKKITLFLSQCKDQGKKVDSEDVCIFNKLIRGQSLIFHSSWRMEMGSSPPQAHAAICRYDEIYM